MLKIRLQRHGARHAPFYRVVVAEATSPRDGRFIEILGTYNPQAHIRTEELKLRMERIDHWLGVGAQPTDTARSLIRQGRMSPEEWLERAEKLTDKKTERSKAKKATDAPTMDEGAGEVDADDASPQKASNSEGEHVPREESTEEPEAKEAEVEEAAEEVAEPEEESASEESGETEKSDEVADPKESSGEESNEEPEAKEVEATEGTPKDSAKHKEEESKD